MFSNPAINVYSHDVMRLVEFYEGLGFEETFRTPEEGRPLSPPHDWLSNLRLAWVADPDGNPIQLAQLHH